MAHIYFFALQELIAKSEGLTRRAKDASPAPNKREPLTLSSLRAAAGNTGNPKPNARKPVNDTAPPPREKPVPAPAAHKKPEKVRFLSKMSIFVHFVNYCVLC